MSRNNILRKLCGTESYCFVRPAMRISHSCYVLLLFSWGLFSPIQLLSTLEYSRRDYSRINPFPRRDWVIGSPKCNEPIPSAAQIGAYGGRLIPWLPPYRPPAKRPLADSGRALALILVARVGPDRRTTRCPSSDAFYGATQPAGPQRAKGGREFGRTPGEPPPARSPPRVKFTALALIVARRRVWAREIGSWPA
jgi:hypothetical protein